MEIESLVDALESGQYAELSKDMETLISSKIDKRVEAKKEEILDNINGVVKSENEDDNSTSDDTTVVDNKEDDSNENAEDDTSKE